MSQLVIFPVVWNIFLIYVCLSLVDHWDSLICGPCQFRILGSCLLGGSEVCSQFEPNCELGGTGECPLIFALILEWLLKQNKTTQAGRWMFGCMCVVIYSTNWPEVVAKKMFQAFLTLIRSTSRTHPSRANALFHTCTVQKTNIILPRNICTFNSQHFIQRWFWNDMQWNLLRSPELIW